jgi:RsmE family RNA methyltransferase
VLQAAASMGCKRLALVKSYRVEKSYLSSPFLKPGAMRAELLLGLEQGRDTVLPEVSVHATFKPFVEDALEPLFPDTARLLPHPRAAVGLPAVDARPAVLAIGPEGGWTEYEAKELEARGFAPFSAGPRILRVDVAVPYLVGQLALRRG